MSESTILNCWKVILDPLISDDDFNSHLQSVCQAQKSGSPQALIATAGTAETAETANLPLPVGSDPPPSTGTESLASAVLNPNPSIIRHVFHVGSLRGYSGTFNNMVIEMINALPVVQYITPVHVTSIQALVGRVTKILNY